MCRKQHPLEPTQSIQVIFLDQSTYIKLFFASKKGVIDTPSEVTNSVFFYD